MSIRMLGTAAALSFALAAAGLAAAGDTRPTEPADPLTVAQARAQRGAAYQREGRVAEALAEYAEAVRLAPGNLDYRAAYGLLLDLTGDHEAGVRQLKAVTENSQYKHGVAWVYLGRLYREMTPPRLLDSVAAYERSLKLDPQEAEAALGLGWVYLTAMQYDRAIMWFRKAVEFDSGRAGEAYEGIGWSYLLAQDAQQAQASAAKARAAGRDVAKLVQAVEKGPPANTRPEVGADIGEPCRRVLSGDASAVDALTAAAPPLGNAVDCLTFAAVNLQDLRLRRAAAAALGKIGPAAAEACVHLKGLRPPPHVDRGLATKEEMEAQAPYEEFLRAVRQAMAKVGC